MDRDTCDLYIYDGDCALCSRFVRFLVAHDPEGCFALMTAQSSAGRKIYIALGLDPDAMETALLRIDGRHYRNLDVFTESLAVLEWPWKAAMVLRWLPSPLANWLYRRIANNRKLLQGKSCPVPTPEIRVRLIE
ncbi:MULTISPECIES: thiol-disulfide oxidoreductase DCC family protein [unclassified Hyphomonas]|jgi:predicted DCC family thiol-disulfide oxidoreductase YuxK|uniref:Probable membrane protein YPO1564 n=2 Tax=root TaxID=1 RepID=A0A160TWP0_9ZZZZ|nr:MULTISPECIES: DCC1-like thiol-disulfide oxidoreductase family protein [unclassified Hyphomonas]MAA80886.1 DUF393 domain-containing protein [Hyphomonas sp.]MAL47218.1 DUF393 domain-containing protein [Hyphomonas sp.]MAX83497.1 DUF393 domain-containing protein [Hyphomonas sp.]MBG67241.1 DUF393 domain-containing protein [Hyphomonas sp.]HAO35824.1 DUF393 domain-containing protein [Hyphomonas sp.]|tara:strand:- start:3131 stop:3532 length:402 start_codon:yes stop_codon:yes gene_type:complete